MYPYSVTKKKKKQRIGASPSIQPTSFQYPLSPGTIIRPRDVRVIHSWKRYAVCIRRSSRSPERQQFTLACVSFLFSISLSLSMWSQELDWNFDRERGTVKRRTVNYFIPVLGEEILHDIELERGKSIKRRNFARVRCQVTLAKRRVFFYEVNKENGRSQGYDIPIQRKEERREIFKRSVYYILYETLK